MEFIIVVVEVVVVIDVKLMVEVEVAGFMVDFVMVIADFKADFAEGVNFAVVIEEFKADFAGVVNLPVLIAKLMVNVVEAVDFKVNFIEAANFKVNFIEAVDFKVNFVEAANFKVNFVEAVVEVNSHFAEVVPLLIADFDFAKINVNFLFTLTYFVVDLAVILVIFI